MNDEDRKVWERRRVLAVEMREKGHSFRDVGQALGVTGTRAKQIIDAERTRRFRPQPQPPPQPAKTEITIDAACNLLKSVDELELTLRAYNSLKKAARERELDWPLLIGDLATLSEAELLELKNVGRTTVEEIRQLLKDHGLKLGMDLPRWFDLRSAIAALRDRVSLALYFRIVPPGRMR